MFGAAAAVWPSPPGPSSPRGPGTLRASSAGSQPLRPPRASQWTPNRATLAPQLHPRSAASFSSSSSSQPKIILSRTFPGQPCRGWACVPGTARGQGLGSAALVGLGSPPQGWREGCSSRGWGRGQPWQSSSVFLTQPRGSFFWARNQKTKAKCWTNGA